MGLTSYKYLQSNIGTWNSWTGAREDYDALTSKVDNTLYYIMDEWDAWESAKPKLLYDWHFSSYTNLKDRNKDNDCSIVGTNINQTTSYLTKTNTTPNISSYVKIKTNVSINLATKFSIGFGLKLKAADAAVIVNDSSTVNYIGVSGSTNLVTLQTSDNNKITFDISTIEDLTEFNSYMITYDIDDTTYRLYINGAYMCDGVVTGSPTVLTLSRFLGGYNSNVDLNGDSGLKYVRVFNDTLTEAEVVIFT